MKTKSVYTKESLGKFGLKNGCNIIHAQYHVHGVRKWFTKEMEEFLIFERNLLDHNCTLEDANGNRYVLGQPYGIFTEDILRLALFIQKYPHIEVEINSNSPHLQGWCVSILIYPKV
jgi:hypothetical protein